MQSWDNISEIIRGIIMKRLRLVLLIAAIAITISACGKNQSKKDVKLVGGPKVEEEAKNNPTNTVKESSDNKEIEEKDKSGQVVAAVKTKPEENSGKGNKESNEKGKPQQAPAVSKPSKKAIPKIEYKLANNTIVIDPAMQVSLIGKEAVAPNSSVLKYKQTGRAQGSFYKDS